MRVSSPREGLGSSFASMTGLKLEGGARFWGPCCVVTAGRGQAPGSLVPVHRPTRAGVWVWSSSGLPVRSPGEDGWPRSRRMLLGVLTWVCSDAPSGVDVPAAPGPLLVGGGAATVFPVAGAKPFSRAAFRFDGGLLRRPVAGASSFCEASRPLLLACPGGRRALLRAPEEGGPRVSFGSPGPCQAACSPPSGLLLCWFMDHGRV